MMAAASGSRPKIKVSTSTVAAQTKVRGGNKESRDDLSPKGGCRVFGARGDAVLAWLVRRTRGYEDIEQSDRDADLEPRV